MRALVYKPYTGKQPEAATIIRRLRTGDLLVRYDDGSEAEVPRKRAVIVSH